MKERKKITHSDKTKKMFEKIVQNVQAIVDSGEYEKFLKFRKNFRNYSFNNLVLIFSQFPDATKVAGKSKWLKIKRDVLSGAKKIFIIAPIHRKYNQKVVDIVDGEEKETIKTIEYNAYRYVYVYDISQTTGKPIPMQTIKLNTNNMNNFYEKLKSFSKFPVYEEELDGTVQGYYSSTENKIVIKKSLSIDDKASVLLHELAHGLYDDFEYKTDRNLSEVFVESIVYIVADNFGLDTSLCSFNYITKWSKGDSKTVIELGTKIQKCANQFIQELENFKMQELNIAA